jgi:hypothetical protein
VPKSVSVAKDVPPSAFHPLLSIVGAMSEVKKEKNKKSKEGTVCVRVCMYVCVFVYVFMHS